MMDVELIKPPGELLEKLFSDLFVLPWKPFPKKYSIMSLSNISAKYEAEIRVNGFENYWL